jgi:hypothetical protein
MSEPIPDEVWKPIPEFEGDYEASNYGRVRSLKRALPYMLKQRHHRYMNVMISMYGKYRPHLVHRLVLMAFVGPPPQPDMHACHIDGDPTNNRLENLYWGTAKENAADMRRHGRHRNGRKTHCARGHEFTPENTYRSPKKGERRCRTCIAAYQREATRRRGLTKRRGPGAQR